MENVPVTDNHIHVDPINGEGPLEVAKKFERVGGNVMIIPNKPTWTVSDSCSLNEAMERVVHYVNKINQETNVKAYAIVGTHPAELSRFIKNGVSLKKSEEIMIKAFEKAQKLVINGEAIGIGEIGRPHYDVSPDEMEIHNRLMLFGMELAAEADCAVQLHTESAQEKEFEEFASMAIKSNLKKYRVIKHFSGPLVDKSENFGITPSLISTRKVITEGIRKGNNFLMETDYLDDLSRPGAVLGPKTVPRRTKEFIRKEIITLEDAYKIHVENVERVYGIDLDL
ncbi:MAG: TatD family hydrolase [Methanomicrobiales archaeon]